MRAAAVRALTTCRPAAGPALAAQLAEMRRPAFGRSWRWRSPLPAKREQSDALLDGLLGSDDPADRATGLAAAARARPPAAGRAGLRRSRRSVGAGPGRRRRGIRAGTPRRGHRRARRAGPPRRRPRRRRPPGPQGRGPDAGRPRPRGDDPRRGARNGIRAGAGGRGPRARRDRRRGDRTGPRMGARTGRPHDPPPHRTPRRSELAWPTKPTAPRTRASLDFLRGLIARRGRRTEAQLLTAVATLGAPEATGLLRRSLRAPDPDVRAQAIEAIDALGDRELAPRRRPAARHRARRRPAKPRMTRCACSARIPTHGSVRSPCARWATG